MQYREVNAIFGTSPIDDATTKERAIYFNKAQRDNYPAILTSPPSSPGRPIYFSETNAYTMHFSHNDILVMTMHIGCCGMSKISMEKQCQHSVQAHLRSYGGHSRVGSKDASPL